MKYSFLQVFFHLMLNRNPSFLRLIAPMTFLFHTAVFFAGNIFYYNIHRVAQNSYATEYLGGNDGPDPLHGQLLIKKENGEWQTGKPGIHKIVQLIGEEIENYLNR